MPDTEVTPEQASADFLSGFQSVTGSEAPAPEVKTEETKTEPAALDADELQAITDDEYTPEQMQTLLAKVGQVDQLTDSLAKANGKIGEFNRTLTELREQVAKQTPVAPEDPELAQFMTDYPEVAAAVEKFAQKRLADESKAHPAMTDEQLNERVATQVAQARAELATEFNRNLLDSLHEDWQDVVTSAGYKLWLATRPQADQETALSTTEAKPLAKIITAYKGFTDEAARKKQQNKERLEKGVSLDGVPNKQAARPTETDEFLAGFRSVRGN